MSRWPTAIRCSTRRRAPEALSLTTRSQSESGNARSSRTSGKPPRSSGKTLWRELSLGRRQQQSLHPMRDEVLDIFTLQPQVALAVAEEDAIAGASRRGLGAAHHRREERVDDVGHDQADRLGLSRNQAARDPVRHIVELGDRFLDPALRLGVDAVRGR